jgi:Xaa-Pro aminopeptidase
MTIGSEEDLERLKAIGRVCATARDAMAAALRPGITTAELDAIGKSVLDAHGARSAPALTYDFPGTTCISVNEEVAHGIPGDRVIAAGDLVNIDVSAELDGVFADTGASFVVEGGNPTLHKLCRDGKRAAWTGIRAVRSGAPMADIGNAIGAFARKHGYPRSPPGRIAPSGGASPTASCSPSSPSCRWAARWPSSASRQTASRCWHGPLRPPCSSSTPWSQPRAGRSSSPSEGGDAARAGHGLGCHFVGQSGKPEKPLCFHYRRVRLTRAASCTKRSETLAVAALSVDSESFAAMFRPLLAGR